MSAPILLALRLAMIVVLYLFIGWAFYTLWRDLRRQTRLMNMPRIPPIQLISSAPGGGRPYNFSSQQVFVGRDPACECYLLDKTISARHARLYYENTQWWVEDLESTNGSFLNQEQLHVPVALTGGDRLQFGQVGFIIAIGELPNLAS